MVQLGMGLVRLGWTHDTSQINLVPQTLNHYLEVAYSVMEVAYSALNWFSDGKSDLRTDLSGCYTNPVCPSSPVPWLHYYLYYDDLRH